jgi:hypothetical protein
MMGEYRTIHWTRAVEINHIALTRILAEIFALLGLVTGSSFDRLPQALYQSVERLLRPTESALRRLIVIAARGIVVKPVPKRPMPKGLKIARKAAGPKASGPKAAGPMSFRLFDTRKPFDFIQSENPLFVYVKTYTSNPFNLFEQFRRQYPAQPAEQDDSVNAIPLSRRLAAVKHALETIPRQAQRMARWQARRKMMEKPKFTSPLRPGLPPGHRQKPKLDVDFILQECHGLAWDALREDSS